MNGDLALGITIMVVALGFFVWHLFATTRRAGLLLSEGRTPRRYLLLGVAAGCGILYATRR